MKKAIVIIGLMFGFFAMQAQKTGKQVKTNQAPELDCYNKWAKKFKERGADEVLDGSYNNVIVVIREAATVNCYDGKVEVKEGLVQSFSLLLEDGVYEAFAKELKQESRYVVIENGMSKTMIAKDGTRVNILWPKKIKPKKAPIKKAADPSDD